MKLIKSKIIKAPIDLVWSIISDLTLMGELTPTCEKVEILTEHTKGLGTQSRWHSKLRPGKSTVEEIIVWQPLDRLSWQGPVGEPPVIIGELAVTPITNGHTLLTFSEDFLSTEVDLLQNELGMEKELDSVKKYIEEKASS
jgi:hypothetical protein